MSACRTRTGVKALRDYYLVDLDEAVRQETRL
jgi:hypothetical protein